MAGGQGLRIHSLYPEAEGLQIIPTLSRRAYKQYLHWAIWSLRDIGRLN